MKLIYVIGLFPKTSETFILGEIQELVSQGEQVQVCSLRPPLVRGPLHPGAQELVDATVYVDAGLRGAARMLVAAVCLLCTRPRRTLGAAGWALRWAAATHSPAELARFGQACVLARALDDGDHIHAHFAHGPASAALLLSRLMGVPFSFTGHAREIFERFRDPILAAKAAEARFVVAISEHGQARMLDAVRPVDAHKVVVIRNGIDLDCFTPPNADEPVRSRGRLVSVARAVPMKGLSTLVDACAVLVGRGLDISCEIVGDGPLRGALQQQATQLGISERVRLSGAGSRDVVVTALRNASIFALPSRPDAAGDMDGLPVSVVEAMAVGLPVVSTPVTGIPEVVHHGETGLLVPPDDPRQLADALEQLLTDEPLRSRMGHAARLQALQFDRARWVSRLRELMTAGPAAPVDPDLPVSDNDAPDVSVIMSVYNGLPYVTDAVRSVLEQRHPSFELVVVDDGSTDGTLDALSEWRDARLRVISRPHEGRVAAMNTAVTAARGRYLANLDADDLALPGRLLASAEYLDAHPSVGAVGSALQPYVGRRGYRRLPKTDRALRWSMLLRNPMFHSSVTYRASVVRELGGFDPAYDDMCDDADLLLRIASRHRVANLPVPLSVRRLHADQHFGSQPGQRRARLHARCRHRAARELPFPTVLRPVATAMAMVAASRSWVVLGVLGRNGRINHRKLARDG